MGEGNFLLGLGVKLDSCTMGTDFLGRVVYPNNTLVNASYINEADDVMYEYGTNWFTKIPEGATVLVQNAGKAPLQGCICLTDDELTEQFNQYNNGVVGFEYQSGKLDMALFANVLNHKIHQTDEYTFISNFIFSRSLTETAYEGVAQPENPDPVNPGKPEEPGKPDAPRPATPAASSFGSGCFLHRGDDPHDRHPEAQGPLKSQPKPHSPAQLAVTASAELSTA